MRGLHVLSIAIVLSLTAAGQEAVVTIDVTDTPVGKVVSNIGRQVGLFFYLEETDTGTPVSLTVRRKPVDEALAVLGLARTRQTDFWLDSGTITKRWWKVIPTEERDRRWTADVLSREACVLVDVGRVGGRPLARRITTAVMPTSHAYVEWDVSRLTHGEESLEIERCAVHSPGKVLAPDAGDRDVTVWVEGVSFRHTDRLVTFHTPGPESRFEVDGYVITVAWPEVEVRSPGSLPGPVLSESISPFRTSFVLKPGVEKRPDPGFEIGGAGGGSFGRRRAWCGCLGKPRQGEKSRPPRVKSARQLIAGGAENHALDEIAAIEIRFGLPHESRFEMAVDAVEPGGDEIK